MAYDPQPSPRRSIPTISNHLRRAALSPHYDEDDQVVRWQSKILSQICNKNNTRNQQRNSKNLQQPQHKPPPTTSLSADSTHPFLFDCDDDDIYYQKESSSKKIAAPSNFLEGGRGLPATATLTRPLTSSVSSSQQYQQPQQHLKGEGKSYYEKKRDNFLILIRDQQSKIYEKIQEQQQKQQQSSSTPSSVPLLNEKYNQEDEQEKGKEILQKKIQQQQSQKEYLLREQSKIYEQIQQRRQQKQKCHFHHQMSKLTTATSLRTQLKEDTTEMLLLPSERMMVDKIDKKFHQHQNHHQQEQFVHLPTEKQEFMLNLPPSQPQENGKIFVAVGRTLEDEDCGTEWFHTQKQEAEKAKGREGGLIDDKKHENSVHDQQAAILAKIQEQQRRGKKE